MTPLELYLAGHLAQQQDARQAFSSDYMAYNVYIHQRLSSHFLIPASSTSVFSL